MSTRNGKYEQAAKKMMKDQCTLKALGLKTKDISAMKGAGYQIFTQMWKGERVYFIPHGVENPYVFVSGKSSTAKEYKWLELSDIHGGSKQFDQRGLSRILELASKNGFHDVHFSGDLADGLKVYSGQNTNLAYFTAEDQVQSVSDVAIDFPSLNWIIIKGNHDFDFEKRGSSNPCAIFEQVLKENKIACTYMNGYVGDIVIGGVVKRMVHLGGGSAYAKSYPGQVYIRNLVDSHGLNIRVRGDKYRLRFLQFGHLHTNIVYESAGIYCSHPGNFQFPNDFTQRKGLVGDQGARFSRAVISGDNVLKYRSEFIKARDY